MERDVGPRLRHNHGEGTRHVGDEALVGGVGLDARHDEGGHQVAVPQHDDVVADAGDVGQIRGEHALARQSGKIDGFPADALGEIKHGRSCPSL